MPILYMFAAIYFGATYIVQKVLLFRFHKKSMLNTNIVPLYSQSFLKVGLLVHLLMGYFMITNENLVMLLPRHRGQQDNYY